MSYFDSVYCAVRMANDANGLSHHGVKGQVHGRRRYQYEDGTLTPEGRIHYGIGQGVERLHRANTSDNASDKVREKNSKDDLAAKEQRKAKIKKILAIAGGITLAGIAAYGIYKGSGKLQFQLRDQAKRRARYLIQESERLRIGKAGELRKMQAAKDLM